MLSIIFPVRDLDFPIKFNNTILYLVKKSILFVSVLSFALMFNMSINFWSL